MAPWDLERPTQKVWILLVVDILTQYCLKTCKRTVRKVSDVIEILDWMNRVLYISGLVRCKEDFTFLHIIHSSLKQSKKWSSAYAPGPCHVQVIVSWKKTKKKGGKTHIVVRVWKRFPGSRNSLCLWMYFKSKPTQSHTAALVSTQVAIHFFSDEKECFF